MLDDLRRELDDSREQEVEDIPFPIDFGDEEEEQVARPSKGFLGMSAGERAFLSVVFFFNVLLLGALLLLITNRIG